jgi:ABC-type Mn2+/Zn2+ transport system ATPase subunit
MNTVIDVKNLTVKYENTIALYDVNFSINKGTLAIIIGPNGAGKSTLIKAILNLVPFQGEVKIFGKPFNKLTKEEHLKIGYVPQKFHFNKILPITVNEIMHLSFAKVPIEKQEKEKRIEKFLKMAHLEKFRNHRIGELSGGQMQRVLIARALTFLPEIILMDEPLAGIDVAGEKTFYEFIDSIHKNFGITIMLVSHDVTSVDKYADIVLCLNKRLVCYGKPGEVLTETNFHKLYGSDMGAFRHKPCPKDGPCELYKEQEVK